MQAPGAFGSAQRPQRARRRQASTELPVPSRHYPVLHPPFPRLPGPHRPRSPPGAGPLPEAAPSPPAALLPPLHRCGAAAGGPGPGPPNATAPPFRRPAPCLAPAPHGRAPLAPWTAGFRAPRRGRAGDSRGSPPATTRRRRLGRRAAAAAMAHPGQDDLPVLPSNFFNDPAQTGHWIWEADFKDVVEIGKGKVRQGEGEGGGGGGGGWRWPPGAATLRPLAPARIRMCGDAHPPAPPPAPQDTVIYSAVCPKLGAGRRVAVKVYDKTKVQATKYRAIKREIAMMMFFQRQRCARARLGGGWAGASARLGAGRGLAVGAGWVGRRGC